LAALNNKYNAGIELTTKGEFAQALDSFRSTLQAIPLVVLASPKDQKDLNDFIRKISEYITAMRIEIERKRLVAAVNSLIFSCYIERDIR